MGFAKQRMSPPALVGSYPTVSPLPSCLGGLLSVALSLTLRPVDVIDHPALRSPDFPLCKQSDRIRFPKAITNRAHQRHRCNLISSFRPPKRRQRAKIQENSAKRFVQQKMVPWLTGKGVTPQVK